MATAALSQHAVNMMEYAASAGTGLKNGCQGWIKDSPVIWIATASSYYGLQFAAADGWLGGMDVNHTAAFVCVAASAYAFANGILAKQEGKDKPISALPNIKSIIMTNAVAVSLYMAHKLNLELVAYKALTVAVVAYTASKILHLLVYDDDSSEQPSNRN